MPTRSRRGNRNRRQSSTTQSNIRRAVTAQRYNGAGRWGTGGGGRYVAERNANGRATNSGRRNARLGNRDMRRNDLRSTFLSNDFNAYAQRHGIAMGVGRVAAKG